MFRTLALVALALSLAGCSRYHTRAQGPFGKPAKEPPPPYGAAPRPVGGQSPLDIASVAPAPKSPDEPSLVPPQTSGLVPAGGTLPAPAAVDTSSSSFPPFRRRPEPKPNPPPTPPAPKDTPPAPPPPKNAPDAPAGPSPAAKNLGELKALLATANASWKAVDTYETTLTRRELNPKGEVNSEVLIFQFRREPMSVFTRNVSESGKGREVIYYPAKHGDKLHVMLGQGDNRFVKAGIVAPPVSPDDPRVKEKARYSIRDAGFGRTVGTLTAAVAKLEAGKVPPDSISFDGEVNRAEYPHPLVGVTHTLRPGDDPLLPTGGTRLYFFNMKKDAPSYGLPVLGIATDAAGKEAEYYLFEKVTSPAGLTDADFDPARLKK